MNLAVRFRDRTKAVAQAIADEFDNLVATIRAHLDQEHNDDGTHARVTATSLSTPAAAVDSEGLYLQPTDVGNFPALARTVGVRWYRTTEVVGNESKKQRLIWYSTQAGIHQLRIENWDRQTNVISHFDAVANETSGASYGAAKLFLHGRSSTLAAKALLFAKTYDSVDTRVGMIEIYNPNSNPAISIGIGTPTESTATMPSTFPTLFEVTAGYGKFWNGSACVLGVSLSNDTTGPSAPWFRGNGSSLYLNAGSGLYLQYDVASSAHAYNFVAHARNASKTEIGYVQSRQQADALIEQHIRAASGKKSYLTFTEDTVADRWAIGCENADGTLYFRSGAYDGTHRVSLTSLGRIVYVNPQTVASNYTSVGRENTTNELVLISSDRASKKDIESVDLTTARAVLDIPPARYRDKNSDQTTKKIVGVMADDIPPVLNDLVTECEVLQWDEASKKEKTVKVTSVHYDRLAIYFLPLIKDLTERVAALEAKVN